MNKRENLLALLRREPFEEVPVEFNLCPSLVEEYKKRTKSELPYYEYFGMPWRNVEDIRVEENPDQYLKYYKDIDLKEGTNIDIWGVAHEPGSEAAKHMTYMRCPLKGVEDLEEVMKYPFPNYAEDNNSHQKKQVDNIHAKGLAAVGNMQCTIWESAWYIRSMEDLMTDMMCEDPIAEFLLDKVTEISITRASSYARAGVDILFLGDDIGMQYTQMMSDELYCEWLLPRLKKVIRAAKEINPDILVFYHSCGFVTPFIPYLIEAGVDVLNPLQSECMDFEEIYQKFGGQISFHGAVGTQTTMPFGTPEEIKAYVHKTLDIASEKGGLFIAPTHLLEPEVPWENIIAYVEACKSYK